MKELSSSILTFAPGYRLRQDPDGQGGLLAPEALIRLNETAHRILLLVDGRRTVSQILNSLKESYPAKDHERLEKETLMLIQRLVERKALVLG
jgi:coenzyme PQQ biosynthesis protein PqqD